MMPLCHTGQARYVPVVAKYSQGENHMSSIKTNVAAMTALQIAHPDQQEPDRDAEPHLDRLRVAEASDNAAYWSIATTMRSDKAALSTVQDALGLGAAWSTSPTPP